MPGDFSEKMDELIELVGDGEVRGEVVVDQVYAKYQHEGLDLKHPQGGRAKYLSYPLMMQYKLYVQLLADDLLRGGGVGAMKLNMEDLADQVYKYAPVEFWDLRRSGHPMVYNNDELVYDRAPVVHRLTATQLKEKDHIRSLGRRIGLW